MASIGEDYRLTPDEISLWMGEDVASMSRNGALTRSHHEGYLRSTWDEANTALVWSHEEGYLTSVVLVEANTEDDISEPNRNDASHLQDDISNVREATDDYTYDVCDHSEVPLNTPTNDQNSSSGDSLLEDHDILHLSLLVLREPAPSPHYIQRFHRRVEELRMQGAVRRRDPRLLEHQRRQATREAIRERRARLCGWVTVSQTPYSCLMPS